MQNKKQIVISGNNLDLLKNYPDNYFDSIVTDPPYGLGKEPNAEEMLKSWVTEGYLEVKGGGFMGKEWDSFVPQPIFWKEIYRVLKFGGHVVAFFGTRTYDWGCMAIRLGGFEIRDCIQWLYGSGFPKSHNIEKAINKIDGVEFLEHPANGVGFMKEDSEDWNVTKNQLIQQGESTERAKKWQGWGSALKPANEPIVLARKPLEKGLSIAENVLKWGTGAINIDVSRISHNEEQKFTNREQRKEGWNMDNCGFDSTNNHTASADPSGRFPSNVILTHHPDCVCVSYREEIIEDWNCHEDCPIRILDEQSGESKSSKSQKLYVNNTENRNVKNSASGFRNPSSTYSDKGGASRFFYVAKTSQWERNFGCNSLDSKKSASAEFRPNHLEKSNNGENGNPYGRWSELKNNHPTIKPIKLMQYLVRMITPQNGIVLDPFAGSGTTGIACKIDGFEFVGLELSEEYTAIANARLEAFNEENLLIDETIIYKCKSKNDEDENKSGGVQLNLF